MNGKKTQMVCVCTSATTNVTSYIRNLQEDSSRIKSSDEMKILGFYFSSSPTVNAHVEHISKKFRKRLWFLRNIKRATLEQNELLECYCCFLRPILEFCCSVFHPMLNQQLTSKLEKLQMSALRIIYGYNLSLIHI